MPGAGSPATCSHGPIPELQRIELESTWSAERVHLDSSIAWLIMRADGIRWEAAGVRLPAWKAVTLTLYPIAGEERLPMMVALMKGQADDAR